MKDDKKIVINYFKTKSIEARHYPRKKVGKKANFELYIDNKLFALCELKTIIKYKSSGGLIKGPTMNKIQKKIHEASKQFNDSNPNHNIPNILTFINYRKDIIVNDLWYVLTGEVSPGTLVIVDLFSKRVKEDISIIDFFIWMDKHTNKIYYIWNTKPAIKESLKSKISSELYEPYNI